MWLERFVIIVPTLTWQRLSVGQSVYVPTWVEWSILAGCISLFLLLYAFFTKVFPIISIWEIREGREKAVAGRRRGSKAISQMRKLRNSRDPWLQGSDSQR